MGVTPSEIVVTSAVADVLETHWQYYEMYMAYFDHVRMNVREHETVEMRKILTGEQVDMVAATTGKEIPPLVYITQLSSLINIINMPLKWQLYVAVSVDSPITEIKQHLIRIRDALIDGSGGSYFGSYDDSYVVIATLRSIVKTIEREITEDGQVDDGDDRVRDVRGLVHAAMRNAVLLAIDNNQGHLGHHHIPWLALYELLHDAIVNKIWASKILNTLATFAGIGDYQLPTFHGVQYYLSKRSMETIENNVPQLYDIISSSAPVDIDPELYGLGPIIHELNPGPPELVNRLFYSVVTWVNYNSILYVMHVKTGTPLDLEKLVLPGHCTGNIPSHWFPDIVSLLAKTTVGIPGLLRMKEILVHYLKDKYNLRAELFIRAIVKVLPIADYFTGLGRLLPNVAVLEMYLPFCIRSYRTLDLIKKCVWGERRGGDRRDVIRNFYRSMIRRDCDPKIKDSDIDYRVFL